MTDERKQEEGQKKIGEGVERDELSGGGRAGRGRRGGERGGVESSIGCSLSRGQEER